MLCWARWGMKMQIHPWLSMGRAQHDGSSSTKCIRPTLTVPATSWDAGDSRRNPIGQWAASRSNQRGGRPYAIPHTPDIHHVARMRSIRRRQARQSAGSRFLPLGVPGRGRSDLLWMLSSMQATTLPRSPPVPLAGFGGWAGIVDVNLRLSRI